MPSSPIVQLLLVLVFAGSAFALWKGSSVERIGAGILLANVALGMFAPAFLPDSISPIFRLINDALTAVAMLGVTLFYTSPWLGGALIFYAAQFTLHSYYFVVHKPVDRFHAMVNNANFMGIILCLTIGTILAWRARVKASRPS